MQPKISRTHLDMELCAETEWRALGDAAPRYCNRLSEVIFGSLPIVVLDRFLSSLPGQHN